MTEDDDRDVDDLVRLFAARTGAHELDLSQAVVVLLREGVPHRLHLPRAVLARALRQVADDDALRGGLTAGQACAGLMAVHLDESLETRAAHESGWWSYDGGFFEPEPPWEAHRRTRA